MKKFFLHILLVGVLGMLAVSCSDEFDSLGLDSNKTQVVFSIGMDSPIARSRAAWGEGYNPSDGGDAYDNRINPDQLYVKITHGGQTYDVKKILKWQDGKNLSSHTFVGEVDIDLKGQEKDMAGARIEVFANWNPDAENGNVFSQGADYIPMWGVQTADITLAPGKREELSTISLIRAMAKLQVNLTKEMFNEYALKKVSLSKYNTTGYCLPTGSATAQHTTNLGLEEVLNPKTDANQSALELPVVVEDSMYVVYLPEVVNDGETDEKLLKITVQLAEKKDGKLTGNTEEGNFFIKDYADADNPKVIDIVRNHWYKYEIKGFAASEIQLNYAVLDWNEIGIEIGGEGFLFLNKDVIEIYNANSDTEQLKFSSSSPIDSIKLVDLYTHETDGDIIEGAGDGVNAYYISKFGQKIQLGTDPGFDFKDKEAILANEKSVLNAITATFDPTATEGNIKINSPFIGHSDFSDSHNDTPRYLEFKVYSGDLWATFRVVQYPPVVITNEEGFFSYRDDFCEGHHELGTNQPPVHWLNYQQKAYILAFLQDTEIHQVDPLLKDQFGHEYSSISSCPGAKYTFKELLLAEGNMIWYKSSTYPYGEFLRDYYDRMGTAGEDQLVGVPYRDVDYVHPNSSSIDQTLLANLKGTDRDGWWRKHYTGSMTEFFMSKVIYKVYREGIDNNGQGYKRLPGQADIYHHFPNGNGGWRLANKIVNVNTLQFNNNRMYHIKTQQITDKFIIGYPEFVEGDSVLIENKANANLVSPSFMVASQLGTTEMPKNDHPGIYEDASPQIIYDMAKIHCKQYVETKFEDNNGNGIPEPELGEKVTYYRNWRLPTKAEIDFIIKYQNSSRAMDVLLTGQRYACVTGDKDILFSDELEGYKNSGYFMRCVRDVKPGQDDNK